MISSYLQCPSIYSSPPPIVTWLWLEPTRVGSSGLVLVTLSVAISGPCSAESPERARGDKSLLITGYQARGTKRLSQALLGFDRLWQGVCRRQPGGAPSRDIENREWIYHLFCCGHHIVISSPDFIVLTHFYSASSECPYSLKTGNRKVMAMGRSHSCRSGQQYKDRYLPECCFSSML